jgi:hypothetical protein
MVRLNRRKALGKTATSIMLVQKAFRGLRMHPGVPRLFHLTASLGCLKYAVLGRRRLLNMAAELFY